MPSFAVKMTRFSERLPSVIVASTLGLPVLAACFICAPRTLAISATLSPIARLAMSVTSRESAYRHG